MQNGTIHPKSQIISYTIIWMFLKGSVADQNMVLCENCRELNF